MVLNAAIPAVLMFAGHSLTAKLMNGINDDTFSGIYSLSPFDLAMLIPYFTILVILSVYGLHRYETIRVYFKHRKKLLKEPPEHFKDLPRVTVQLPLYNERFVVKRLLEETMNLDYPRELLQFQVLDDSTDETH